MSPVRIRFLRRCHRFILTALLAAVAGPAASRDLHVDAVSGSDTSGDGSAAAPWKSLTHALGQGVAPADHVHLAAGLYDAANGESFPIAVPQDVSLHGAVGGATVIRDDLAAGGRPVLVADIGSTLGSLWLIEGLEIAGTGAASGAVGVALNPGRGQGPVLHGNHIHDFQTGVRSLLRVVAGAELDLDSRPFLDSNRLSGNDVAISIEIDLTDVPGQVRERTEVVNNLVIGNRVGYLARVACSACNGIDVSVDDPVIDNTFAGNLGDAARLEGGDCAGLLTNAPDFTNNVFAGNLGRSIVHDACAVPRLIESNDFWQNAAGGDEPAAGNLFVNPSFVNPALGDYHLRTGSPCIDAGQLLADPATDVDGNPRILDGDGDLSAVTDIGADEHRPTLPALLRAVCTAIDPITPQLSLIFPFARTNPLTPVLVPVLLPGDRDPTMPNILTDLRFRLALYQTNPATPGPLHAVKDAAAGTLRFSY